MGAAGDTARHEYTTYNARTYAEEKNNNNTDNASVNTTTAAPDQHRQTSTAPTPPRARVCT